MLHAAIFDAVNNIDRDFEPYAVHQHVSRRASAQAAADQAAHDVLISLYPLLQRRLILSFSRYLTQIPYGPDKAEGIEEGQDVAAEILALRSNDGSAAILPSSFRPPQADFVCIVKCRLKKQGASQTVVHCALETWDSGIAYSWRRA
jgi:hypothetical protein